MKYKLILFDLDGTLLDTSPGIFSGIDYLTTQLNRPALDEKIKAKFIGPPLSLSYPKYLGVTGKEMENAIKIYRSYNNEIGYKDFRIYEKMEDVLRELKYRGYLLGVVTMKEHNVSQKVIQEAGFDKYFDLVLGNVDVNSYTKAELIDKALEDLAVTSEKAILIGDTELDAQAADLEHMDYLPATYGFGYSHDDSIERYPYVEEIKTPIDLLNFFEKRGNL